MKKSQRVLPILAENVLIKADIDYKINGSFSDDILQELHSIYGVTLENAMELLDKSKTISYTAKDSGRCLYAIGKGNNQMKLYEHINFCFCETFRKDVLETANSLTCEHVLAIKLAEITGIVIKEEINDLHFVELLKTMSEKV